jgi:hypothetical protein
LRGMLLILDGQMKDAKSVWKTKLNIGTMIKCLASGLKIIERAC